MWEAFINSFGTYKSLMSAIKEEYDSALHTALKASAENMSMRTTLAEAEERKVMLRCCLPDPNTIIGIRCFALVSGLQAQ